MPHPAVDSVTSPRAAKPGSEAAVLRAALAAERDRTTELRHDLDEAHVALALAEQEEERLRQQRDLWAARAKVLAAALAQDAADAQLSQEVEIRSVA